MAPIKRGIRAKTQARTRAQSGPRPPKDASFPPAAAQLAEPAEPSTAPFADFSTGKKDKQRMRHSALLNRISRTAPGANKVAKRRRRPGRKLVADLDGLLGALPDVQDGDDGGEWVGLSDDDDDDGAAATVRNARPAGAQRMEMRSVRSRPGAMKRRAKMERSEKERFARNMAQMAPARAAQPVAGVGPEQGGAATVADRWAALRGFIGQTAQRSSLFQKQPQSQS